MKSGAKGTGSAGAKGKGKGAGGGKVTKKVCFFQFLCIHSNVSAAVLLFLRSDSLRICTFSSPPTLYSPSVPVPAHLLSHLLLLSKKFHG